MLAQQEPEILDDLLQLIRQGRFQAHDKLPSENELANHYKIPRIHVRNAFLKLEEMGYIYSQQGKGRFLKPARQQMELLLTGSASFSESVALAGHHLVTRNLGCVKIPYDPEIYTKLRVNQCEDVFMISRLHVVDSVPTALQQSYVTKSVFPHIAEDGSNIQSMFSYFAEQGFTDYASDQSTLSISFPTNAERLLFKCEALVPLLVVESKCLEKNQNIVLEYKKVAYRSDLFTYVIDCK